MATRRPSASRPRITVPAARLDRYLTEYLRRTPGFEAVDLSAGYRLSAPDVHGRNWSGDVVHLRGPGAPASEIIEAALRPIVCRARERFNLSE
jgi:hypothetical protein